MMPVQTPKHVSQSILVANSDKCHRHNLGGGKYPPKYFLYLRISFGYGVEGWHIKNWGNKEGKGCMYIKDSLKPVFPLFLT